MNPNPVVTNTPLTQTICSGGSTTLVTLTSNVAGATFAWTATAPAGVTGFTASGTGTIPVQTITTTGTTQGTVTYAITPTAAGCTGSVTNYTVLVNPVPLTPTQTIDCSLGFGNAVITITNPTGAGIDYSLDGGPYQAGVVFTGVVNGSHSISVRNASGCITTGSTFQISCGCVNGPTLALGSNSGSTCGTTPVTISGNTFGGTATAVTISENGAGSVNPSSISTSPFAFTYTPLAGDAGNTVTITVTTNNPLGSPCASAVATYTLTVNNIPSVPIVGTITQPTCTVATGSVILSGLPSGTWTINPGAITGTGTSTTISLLASGDYNFTVTNAAGCISAASASVTINAQPETPAAPIVGTITQPTCTVSTGTVVLSGLPSGTWTINPGAIAGTGTSTTVSLLASGDYNFTVTNAAGCVSATSANVLINTKPNCIPVAVNDTVTTIQNTPLNIRVTSNDYDLDGTIDVGTVDLNPSIPGIQTTFTVAGQGTYSVNSSGVVTFTPTADFYGTTTPVSYTVNDNSGATSNIATITTIVIHVNHPPKIDLPDVTTFNNNPVTICSPITDPDSGDSFTAFVCSNPKNGAVGKPTISTDGKNVCIVYTPGLNFNGKDSICVTVCDQGGLCGSSTSVITATRITLETTSKPVTCAGNKDGAINLAVTGGTAPYIYQWTGPGSFTSTSKDLTALAGGTYNIKVADANGAINTASVGVVESDALLNLITTPKAVIQTMSIDQTIILGVTPGSINLTVSGGTAPFTYTWNGPGGFSANSEDITDLQGGTYTVSVTDANGCTMIKPAQVDVQIVLSEDQTCVVTVPNVFTPNGDGINDYFEISCLYNYANAQIEIFNRNGNMLFKRDHYGNIDYWGSKEKAFWSGRSENSLNFMGSELPVGTYYYILKLGNGKVLTGFVFLAR